jgi:TPR repeat protein
MTDAPPVFISYASKDRKVAATICAALEHRGLNCWISSRDVAPGENFQEAIVHAMRSAKVMVLIFTGNANNSSEIKKEVALAGQFNLVCIPVRVEDVTPNDAFTYEFATRQWIDLFDDWEQALERLMLQLGVLVGDPRPTASQFPVVPRDTQPETASAPPPVTVPDRVDVAPAAIVLDRQPPIASVAAAATTPTVDDNKVWSRPQAMPRAAKTSGRKKQLALLLLAALMVGGTWLMIGQKTPQQAALAVVSKSAEQGDASSQGTLGDMYSNFGHDLVQKDMVKALEWYNKAAAQGWLPAQRRLAELYADGQDVPQDDAQATLWYRKAADQGDAEAQAELGSRYASGKGVPKDDAQSLAWYRKAADQNNSGAIRQLAEAYEDKKDYAQALVWYRKIAELLFQPDDQDKVASYYRDGLGVVQDYARAAELYLATAENGDAEGQNQLGYLYEEGHGLPKDDAQAVVWHQKAADAGNDDAQLRMGFLFYNGKGVAQDYAKAFEWFQKAADQDNAEAQNNLGFLYEKGRGVAQNYKQALHWYRKAADQGLAAADTDLGRLYDEGLGVAKDTGSAREWMKKGAAAGDPEATAWLAKH